MSAGRLFPADVRVSFAKGGLIMGSRKLQLLVLACVAAANGCANMNHTQSDALAGGGLGAVAGALIDRRHPGTGAAVGGIAGAAVGAAVGNAEDNADRRARAIAAAQAQPVNGPLTLEQVADMARRGIGDDVIRGQIRTSGTRYNLSPEQITWLHDNGVSDGVINEMQQTAYRHRRVVYAEDPVYVVPPPRPIVYGPAVGVGFGYYHYR
jgi:hypothetical protein